MKVARTHEQQWRDALLAPFEAMVCAFQRARRLNLDDSRWRSPEAVELAHGEVMVGTREVVNLGITALEATQLGLQALQEGCRLDAGDRLLARSLDDVAFAARVELQRSESVLLAVRDTGDTFEQLETCQRLVVQLRRALGAMTRTLARPLDLGAAIDLFDDEDLVATRSLRESYAAFHRVMLAASRVPFISSRVIAAEPALDVLLASPAFPHARLGDKRAVWQLVTRYAQWHLEGRPVDDAFSLWNEFVSTSQRLVLINRREALQRHDVATLELVVRVLADESEPDFGVDVAAALELLRQVTGLDDNLDSLAAAPEVPAGVLRAAAERALRRTRVA